MRSIHKASAPVALLAASLLFALHAPHTHGQTVNRAAADAARAAESFYRFHFARDRGFVRANIAQRRRFLSPELYRLMMYEFRREAAFRKSRPDEVPFITGDPFADAQEYPDSFAVGRVTVRGNTARVPVTFGWRGVDHKQTLQVDLLKRGGRWLVHDVRREGGAGLLKLLRRPVYESDGR